MKKVVLYRILALVAIFVGCVVANEQQLFYHLDHAIAEKRMDITVQQSTGEIVLLEIDNKSLTAIGLWPWKRSIYGQIVEKSFVAGAEELAFDIDFSSSSSPEEDLAFQQALDNANGPVTLALFQQMDVSDENVATLQTNRPIEQLENSAWLATVNVLADPDGLIRHFPYAQEIDGEFYPSLTSVLGGVQTVVPGTFIVDYGVDVASIPTYSVIDLLTDNLPEDALAGKKILVGAGAAELRDTIAVPVHGMMSGPKLQILAADNVLLGRNLGYAPPLWQYALSAVIFVPMFLITLITVRNTFAKLAAFAGLALFVEAVGYFIYSTQPLILQTGVIQAQILTTGIILILFEISFKDLLLTLSHRRNESISALLETIVADSFSGILIADAQGRVVEVSQQAASILANLGHIVDKGAKIHDNLPETMTTLLQSCLQTPELFAHDQSLKTMQISVNDKDVYLEYSITPSEIASESQENEAGRVATILFHDVTQAREEQLRLEYLADHDLLTGLLNREGFCEETDLSMISSMEQNGLIFACQIGRADKVIQSLGVEYADLLMKQIGQKLSEIEDFSIIGCSDQREFLLAKPGATAADAEAMAQRIQQCLDAPFSVRGHSIIPGSHVGVADFKQGGLLAEEVAKAATVALHRSKETREAYLFYTSDLAADVVHRRVLEREIVEALDRDEFILVYQPQVDLKTRKTIGCEALIRWEHRDLGVVRPDLFIPIVEETGMIVDLGRWIIETACCDAMRWPSEATVAVNVSAVQFVRSDILADIQHALDLSGLPKERLNIEITESLFIADPDAIIEKLNEIRAFGVKIALDDFGTGYSSLSYIHQFPLDKIKIDRAFVKDLPASKDSLAVINAVIALARGFDMTIVAEGMENEQQTEILRVIGCHIGQGYFFGKPMTNEEFTDLLTSELPNLASNSEMLVG